MNGFIRFRFSLATLLLAVAWSAIVIRIEATPVVTLQLLFPRPNSPPIMNHDHGPTHLPWVHLGWPFWYASGIKGLPLHTRPWALAADATFGAVLVAALTWVSGCLWRGIKYVFQRAGRPSLGRPLWPHHSRDIANGERTETVSGNANAPNHRMQPSGVPPVDPGR